MKSILLFLLATACFLGLTGPAHARIVLIWPYQELLEKSDLAVIAAPTATKDTQEQIDLPGFPGQRVIGVNTTFKVSAVLKGDQAQKDFVLHHYRPVDSDWTLPDGPTFVYFAITNEPPRKYILFLHRDIDGRYTPVVGQSDPGLGIMELAGVYDSAVDETQTRLGIDIAKVLKDCQTVRPGMTRAELARVFSTEGGLSTVTHRTYVYHDCPYVKVDVDFAPSAPNQNAERLTDIVTRISKPYLDWCIGD